MNQTAKTIEELRYMLRQGGTDEIALEEQTYILDTPLIIDRPLILEGGNASLQCSGVGAFVITSSDVTLRNLSIEGGAVQIMVDGLGRAIRQITVECVVCLDAQSMGIWVGSSASDSSIDTVTISHCRFVKEHGLDGVNDLVINAAASRDGNDIHDTQVSNVRIDSCFFSGKATCNFMGIPGLCAVPEREPWFTRCRVEGVTVENCTMSGSYDTAIAHMANYIHHIDCGFDDFAALYNQIEVGITGLSSTAASPMKYDADHVVTRGVRYIGNTLTQCPDGAGETSVGIALDAAQLDYTTSSSRFCLLEDIEVRDNVITGTTIGIRADGAHAMLDADPPCDMQDNVLRDLRITGNTFRNVEEVFVLSGARIDGRRTDWNWGLDHKMQYWQRPVKNHNSVTMHVIGNCIRDVLIENNMLDGYRYFCKVTGVTAKGHGLCAFNRACDNIVMRGNVGVRGEEHILVEDTWLEDWTHDGGENRVDKSLKTGFENPGAFTPVTDTCCRKEYD